MKTLFRFIYFYFYNIFTKVDLNKNSSYKVCYLDGSNKTFNNYEFKQFKEGIINNLYKENRCIIKEA